MFCHVAHILLILMHIEGAGGIDKQTTGAQQLPCICDDIALQLCTLVHIRQAPPGHSVFVFTEHALARTGHIGEQHIKGESCGQEIFRIVVGHHHIHIAILLDILRQHLCTLSHGLVAQQQTSGRQGRLGRRGFAARSRTHVEHTYRQIARMLTENGINKHGGGLLHIIAAGMKQGVESEIGTFVEVIALWAPGHLFLQPKGMGHHPLAFGRVKAHTHGRFLFQPLCQGRPQGVSHQRLYAVDKFFRPIHLIPSFNGRKYT